MNLSAFYDRGMLSERAYNLCKANKIYTTNDLHDHLSDNINFLVLKRCGDKTNTELETLCSNNPYVEKKIVLPEPPPPIDEIIFSLSRLQREIVNSFILVSINSLSVRSKNALSRHLGKNFKIRCVAEKILLSKSFTIKDVENVGSKCVPEIELYISNIKDFLIKVNQLNTEKELLLLKNDILIQRIFSISKIPNEILKAQSIFLLTDLLLKYNFLFSKDRTIILKKAVKMYRNHKELTLQDIADKVNLTRERVRQIKISSIDKLFNRLQFIQSFSEDLFQKYNIDVNSNFIELDTNRTEEINTTNNISFSRQFITYILYIYLNNSFTLIGNPEDVLLPKESNSRNRHNWNNFYLVERKIASEIDFTSLTNDISNRITDRIEESYSFNFKSYLSKFLTNNNIDILDLLFPICERIINDEFELYLDLEESLNFKRNTYRQTHEYAYEALEQIGKPSKVSEIFDKVMELHPNYYTEEEKLRTSMQRSNGFVPIGRESVYGLKKWEKELDNFKGGTIRTITEEFLLNFDKPKHKEEIENHVKKFRPKTNANSIYNNLYIDESNTFVFYENYYIGLTSKVYPDNFKKLSKTTSSLKHTWEESLEILKEFTKNENRLPYSSGCSKSEEKLYRWFNIQKRKSYEGIIQNEQGKLIIEISERYSQASGKNQTL